MIEGLKVAVVVPCYQVSECVLAVISRVPSEVDRVYCIDDACPEGSGRHIETHCCDPRVRVIYHEQNRGVGGAVKTGYQAARSDGCDVAVKIDGDGQMDPALVPVFVRPIALGLCDYTKGNRFFRLEDAHSMPHLRLFGNAALSFCAKLSTGYWRLFDPTNGYTALHLSVLDLVPLEKVTDRYFFETDLLFRLNISRCVVRDVPMTAVYGNERSSLTIWHIILPFLGGHLRNFFKRIFYNYFLRDFHVASIEFVLGPLLLISGVAFGGYHWWLSIKSDEPATAGTVMISGLLIIVGMQLLLSALNFDLSNTPETTLHTLILSRRRKPDATGHDS